MKRTTAATRTLPPTFTSLYRLFLRTIAASVLNQPSATRELRKLWRPTFDGAARVIRTLQRGSISPGDREKLQRWHDIWEKRMDNTLSLLCVSAQSRGLPHVLTRNIHLLLKSYHRYAAQKRNFERQHWNGQLPPSSDRYKPRTVILGSRVVNQENKKAKWARVDDEAWGAIGEVVLMAEGKHGISLGRFQNEERKTA
ncbi:hypothetical protein AcW1_003818 [Taiwanofungus camphoratus]|nr:hypothetical protein AcW1_003818 [Antrodia cinnamomea]